MWSVLATAYPSWPVDNYSSSNQLSIVKRLARTVIVFLLLEFVYIGSRWLILGRGNRHV